MPLDSNLKNHVKNAVDRLKAKFPQELKWEDLAAFTLSIHETPQDRKFVHELLKRHSEVNSKVLKERNLFKYYPPHGIASSKDLIKYLNRSDASAGIKGADISSVWLTKEEDITEMDKKHQIFVVRNSKDLTAKHVWRDDPTMYTYLDEEFQTGWRRISLPASADSLRRELADIGFKAATEAIKPAQYKVVKNKKSKSGRGAKLTNTHMTGLLKDYSDSRQKASR